MHDVKLTRSLTERIISEAQKTPDREVCGFIGARKTIPRSIYPVRNIAAWPARRFDMDPAEHIAAFKTLRERGEALFAIYHSHPSAPAVPSVHDFKGLGYPQALYLIISLDDAAHPEIRAWRRADERMQEVMLELID